jgi:urate oxidase / 2-oxo-4-hydroxy-4-carboxy-5-ureidoimidazoline decarboxylase
MTTVEEALEGSTPLARKVAADGPPGSAEELIARLRAALPMLTEAEKIGTLNAHPRIGERPDRLSARSRQEQGDDALPELERLNAEYERKFGFRFVVFVNRRPKSEIVKVLQDRLRRGREEEMAEGLNAIVDIAADRLRARSEIRYGKHEIAFYRTHTERVLFAGRVDVDVFGDNFLPAYTEGDNRDVVATDTMKNFVHAMALEYDGDRYEGFAAFLGRKFLEHYPQMQSLRITVRELPFQAHSDKLLSPLDDDYESVELDLDRQGVRGLRCGRRNLKLIKLSGSAFRSFARDEFTTLPDVVDRPLYIWLDVFWRYPDAGQAIAGSTLVSSAKVRDVVRKTFDDFVSMSIQHLVYEMGQRVLAQFPELAEVTFEAQNRLWDTVKVSDADPKKRVYSDPRPAHGVIGLTLRR